MATPKKKATKAAVKDKVLKQPTEKEKEQKDTIVRESLIVEDTDLPGVVVEEDVRRGGSPVDVPGEGTGARGDDEVVVDPGPDDVGDER